MIPISYNVSFQVAHMTKNEMQYLDSSLIGPAMLFLNQYFNFFIKEYYVLWMCFVSRAHIWSLFMVIFYDLCNETHMFRSGSLRISFGIVPKCVLKYAIIWKSSYSGYHTIPMQALSRSTSLRKMVLIGHNVTDCIRNIIRIDWW